MEGAPSLSRQCIEPGAKPLWVGRGPGADVPLRHPTVALRHAVVFRTAGGMQVRDRSGGATRVNGRAVGEVVLRDGDRVDFGAVPFRVEGGKLCSLLDGGGLAVAVENLTVEVKSACLLDRVTLAVAPGEFVGLLGPSGAGKSTLLRCLVGYVKPTRGWVRAEGLELPRDAASYWPQVGYVPQEDVLFATLTAGENLDFALRLRAPSLDRAERRQIITARLKHLNLGNHANRPVGRLSGGERKRVGVAVEMLTGPRALFLDEPTAGLDPANETRVMRELRQLAANGTTVVCATHVLENVRLFHRAVVLVDGHIAYNGPPDGLLQHFGVETYPELYERDRLIRVAVVRAGLSASPASQKLEGPKQTPSGMPLTHQVSVLIARGLRLLARDHGWALMLLLQPILMGVLINLSQIGFTRVSTVFTFAAVTAVWLGLNNTARELVRERRHYVRERLLGVTPGGYLLSKVLLFAVLGLAQLVLLVIVLRYGNFLDPYRLADLAEWPLPGVLATLWAAYLAAALLGLTVSAAVKTQEWAVAMLPMIVLPQLLLSGEAAEMHKAGRFQSVAYLVDRTGQDPRTKQEWAVELASLLTYTRPCVSLLKDRFHPSDLKPGVGRPPSPEIARAVDIGHLGAAILLTGLALWIVFRVRERSWLRALS